MTIPYEVSVGRDTDFGGTNKEVLKVRLIIKAIYQLATHSIARFKEIADRYTKRNPNKDQNKIMSFEPHPNVKQN